MFRPVLTALALAALTSVAHAQSDAGQCIDIANDQQRLSCYDQIFRPVTETLGSVVLQSEQTIPSQPSGRDYARMIVACHAEGLVVRFSFAGNIMSLTGSNVGISFQRDLSRASAMSLPTNATNTELVLNGTPQVVQFLQSLQGANNLTARVTPANSRSLNVRFRVSDIAERVAPVVNACN